MDDPKRTLQRLRLKLRRRVRKQKQQVEDMTAHADDSVNRLVLRRFENLYKVRRFVAAWVAILLFIGIGSVWQVRGLDRHYLELVPTSGGVYREGVIGTFTTANPLFATTNTDASVSRLVFSSLFVVSPEDGGVLQPDLATGYNVDEKGVVYTVTLRKDVQWHDGEQFDAEDVVFTYNTIRNADVNSPLFSSWRDVKVTAKDAHTVEFTIPDTLSAFKFSLTNGIVPEHILRTIEPADLRSSTFNTVDPVGTGPFTYRGVEVFGINPEDRQEKVTFKANETYYDGDVELEGAIIRTYQDEESMIADFNEQLITSMVGLTSLPDNITNSDTVQEHSTPLRSSVMAFFNTSTNILDDPAVRQALTVAVDTDALRSSVGYQLVSVDSPFLKTHATYDEANVQMGVDVDRAKQLLDEADWIVGDDGYRYKDDARLELRVVSQSLPEYATVVQGLQTQWSEVGVFVDAVLLPEEKIQSESIIEQHTYDVLLYGITIGPDPDVFAFWHSSQADPRLTTRLNFSEYSNETADEALEAGRTRLDEDLRKVKYAPFLEAWRDDAPAIGLYQPRFFFVSRGAISGYAEGQFNSPVDRFYGVEDWQIRLEKTVKQ